MLRNWTYLVLLAMFWASGDIIYKYATNYAGNLTYNSLLKVLVDGINGAVSLKFNNATIFVILFGTAMGIAFAANLGYSIPLSNLPVSVAKPALNGLTLAFVAILGVIFFDESLDLLRIGGLVLVTTGVAMLSLSS